MQYGVGGIHTHRMQYGVRGNPHLQDAVLPGDPGRHEVAQTQRQDDWIDDGVTMWQEGRKGGQDGWIYDIGTVWQEKGQDRGRGRGEGQDSRLRSSHGGEGRIHGRLRGPEGNRKCGVHTSPRPQEVMAEWAQLVST